jgi:hypothetical protein
MTTEIVIRHHSLSKGRSDYSLLIDGSGNIEYNGIKNAKMIGRKSGKISTDDLNRIIHQFKDLYFFSFRDNYESLNQHSSVEQDQVSVSLRLGVQYKNVSYTDESRVEPRLKMLVEEIEKLTNADKFFYR